MSGPTIVDYSALPSCPICGQALIVSLSHNKSGRPFVMLRCRDGRHFRAFINDKDYVAGLIERLEKKGATKTEETK